MLPFPCVAAELLGQGEIHWLTSEEAGYVAGSVPKRVREFAAGRACARLALRELEIPCISIAMQPDRQPQWPPLVVGSISHTNGYCAAIVAKKEALHSIGLDCEVVGAVPSDLWAMVCTERELEWLHALSMARQSVAATLLFAAKEAAFKCQFSLTGDWWDFHDVEIEVKLSAGYNTLSAKPLGQADGDRIPATMSGTYRFHDGFLTVATWIPS